MEQGNASYYSTVILVVPVSMKLNKILKNLLDKLLGIWSFYHTGNGY